ncbi:MAG: GDSL family lipase, partial [Comamonadaceae bacterium]|nr:GDSL family lipase [Comamonadaceae bacterium]
MASHWMRRSLLAAACASAALLAACGSSTVDSAISPQRAVVFGDAVNDVGQKGSAYTVNVTDGSRFNWTAQFASYWSLPVTPASKGGSNYAQGNARIGAKPDAAGDASTPTITDQITSFLAANKTFGAQDIVLINGGISDLIAGMAQVNAGQLT